MSPVETIPDEPPTPPVPLTKPATVARLALIALTLGAIAGAVGYLGGWLTPRRLTATRFTDGFDEVNGVHPGFRRNHAKGVTVTGFFESNGSGARLSKASVFRPGRVPVLGRFSLGGGLPYAPDSPSAVRGLGLEFSLPEGELWRTAMINLPVFLFATPRAFYDQLLASKLDPSTGKPDPAKLQAFFAQNPESAAAMKIIQTVPPSSGFGDTTFHGLNAFLFTNEAGESKPVRWTFTPAEPSKPAATSAPQDQDFLFDALIAQLHRGPLRWSLVLTVGQPGDPTNDATIPWPAGREQVDAGTLTLDGVESDDTSGARDINFDPLVLPAGIAPSDDPLLSARSAVYAESFARRSGEKKDPAAISPTRVAGAAKGE